ncbi:hypothetical protein PMI01_02695 [Caulobacter sp. AP07]|uniref:hypothetical protein n=1 Tax=Caulobacter sp. AP07 TaxID=1144304 RepID=UPI0002721135|nr:hypothetical protein [Caulobacter sp. AP07]EJL31818.1 hypothetical protein PMI01_02695 [Caulobacter sp. AP07]
MTLTDALLLLAFLIANMACGAAVLFHYAQVSSIVAQSHPEIWRKMQGYSFAARDAAGRFYCGLAPFRLKDPALSRALVKAWIATGFWITLVIAAFLTAAVREAASR